MMGIETIWELHTLTVMFYQEALPLSFIFCLQTDRHWWTLASTFEKPNQHIKTWSWCWKRSSCRDVVSIKPLQGMVNVQWGFRITMHVVHFIWVSFVSHLMSSSQVMFWLQFVLSTWLLAHSHKFFFFYDTSMSWIFFVFLCVYNKWMDTAIGHSIKSANIKYMHPLDIHIYNNK